MDHTMDTLMDELLQQTMRLEQMVLQADSDPDEWLLLLDKREQLIEQMASLTTPEHGLTASQKNTLERIHEINRRLLSQMQNRHQGVQKKLTGIQRSKAAMHSYTDTGPNAYGAFFDSKK
jgi:flagellar protein FliT